jgi:hypothetical protein
MDNLFSIAWRFRGSMGYAGIGRKKQVISGCTPNGVEFRAMLNLRWHGMRGAKRSNTPEVSRALAIE